MSSSENEQDNFYKNQNNKNKSSKDNQSTVPISWPIILAVVPAFGAFFVGSSEVWTDLIVLFLIIYYVYRWLTVPWSYYESARRRRVFHQHASSVLKEKNPERQLIASELRRHELVGLIWVVLSPFIAGCSLHYSKHILNERYLSGFNITVFMLAASIKPLSHVIALFHERTLYLQTQLNSMNHELPPLDQLQQKIRRLETEFVRLHRAFATKQDLGQVAEDIQPTLEQLNKTIKRCERRDHTLKQWTEGKLTEIESKMESLSIAMYNRIDKDKRQQEQHGMVVSLILLPVNVSLWAVKRMTTLIPAHHNQQLLTSPSHIQNPLFHNSRHSPLKTTIQDHNEYSNEVAAFGY